MSQDEVINLIGYPFAKFDMTQAERTELFGSAVTKVDATWWKYRVEGDILLVGFADDKVVKLDGITGCEFFD